MKLRSVFALGVISLAGVSAIGWLSTNQVNASTNEGNNSISKIVTSGFDKKKVLEVDNKPFYYNGVQVRADKLRDDPKYHFTIDQVGQAYDRAKKDGFTVVNSQLLWSDIQPDKSTYASEGTYIQGGANHEENKSSEQTLKLNDGKTADNESLAFLKFKLSDLPSPNGNLDGVRLRLYASSKTAQPITIYRVSNNNWTANNLTWKNSFGHDGHDIDKKDVIGEKVVSTSYDKVQKENYYDFDVTDLVKAKSDDQVSFVIQSNTDNEIDIAGPKDSNQSHRPQLTVSKADQYNFDYLDQLIAQAQKANIKLEVLWFGADTTSTSTEKRMPFYVLHDYAIAQKKAGSKDSPFLSKSDASSYTGIYNYLMDKNDQGLQSQEGKAIKAVFDHIGDYNNQNGHHDTVIGAQVANEPQVSRLHGSSMGVDIPQSQPSLDAWNKFKQTNSSVADFRSWTMWNYTNNLAKQVKSSKYPVITRVNNAIPADADLIGWNEKMRSQESTDLDVVGADLYGYNYQQLFNYGHDVSTDGTTVGYDRGGNLPMVMEDGSLLKSKSGRPTLADAAPRIVTAYAGGATHNYYDLMSEDGYALYDWENNQFVPEGSQTAQIASTNQMLAKLGYDIATKQSDGADGKNLLFFNAVPSADNNVSVEKHFGGTSITYKTDTEKSMGIADKRDDDNIALASTSDSDATFTLKDFGKITSVTYGQYESPQSDKWITTDGKVTYQKNDDGTYTITVPKYSVVNVSKKETSSGGNTNSGSATVPTTPGNPTNNSNSSSSSSSATVGSTTSSSTTTKTSVKKVKPFKVVAVKSIYEYKAPTFKKQNRVKYLPKESLIKAKTLKVVAVATNVNDVKRYKLSNGRYITANGKYVVKLYLQAMHQKLQVINPKGTWTHSKIKFTKKNAAHHFKKSSVIKAKKLVKFGDTTRYQLKNGNYVTGSKQFVRVYK
ncbi:DUF7594 domain-containing protein [Lentilactobacillus parafarraginis]|jgi:hypothetical protein|uniref:DUF4978 domain-containing protein n=1 Tax=Lentilactobacillus parafarraginis DSM 18390 = JCM 14109 TaxID=1423786 RepID=A0A0R1YIP5_9LACO|nr:DUF5776 domain-containing protein [Lentilactobacillus parafarraginis]KRM42360.1 hypothetical protein FD47_GL001938 [Lentilactobacillus parafarraginis DSM 18390 = JCM 14109]